MEATKSAPVHRITRPFFAPRRAIPSPARGFLVSGLHPMRTDTIYTLTPEADGQQGARSRVAANAMRAYGLRRLARAVDVSHALPSLWLAGKAAIPDPTWRRVAAVIGIPEDPAEIDPEATPRHVPDRSGPKSDASLDRD